jgi:hypothetical protein
MPMIGTRRVRSATRSWVVVVLGSTMAAMLWGSATTAGARVLDRERYSYSTVDHEVACGRHLRVETTVSGFQTNKSAQHGSATTFFDNYNIHEVLTDAAGDGYIIDLQGRYHDVQVRHVRGTIYLYTGISVGQVFTIRTLDGKAVERNSGLLKITYLADTKGDSDPSNDVYSDFQIVKIAGVQPLQTETEAEFCAVIQEAMDS